jgi:hypothetical protein
MSDEKDGVSSEELKEEEEENKKDDSSSDKHQTEGERVAEQSDNEEKTNESMDEITVESETQKGGDSSSEEKKPPPPFEAVTPKHRLSVHDKLRAYESRRRTSFQAKLESSSLYWRSFRDLLQSSVHETARAERLIIGTAKAHQSYADAMQASYQDGFLDKRGQVVMDPKRQKKIAEQRVESVSLAPSKTVKPMALTAEEQKANMLTSIMDAQLSLSKKFGENAQEMQDEIATEVTKQRVELQEKVAEIRVLGDAILQELEITEAEVSEAWESYYTIADKVLGGNILTTSFSSDPEIDNTSSTKASDSCMDVWIVEMQYRVAVSYQLSVWEKASTELSALFASMKETECQRRIDLREYLLAFEQRQERLFLNLPDIYTEALKDLVGRDIDRNAIEEKVQFSIRKRAELLQREEAKSKPPPEKGTGLTGADMSLESSNHQKLDSPLMSELLCKAKVVDRKLPGMMGGWKTTLAVVTADSFLHLFDLPSEKISSGTAPEVAFRELAPKVQVPTADMMRSGKTQFVRGWCDALVPVDSLALYNCNVSSHGTTFEVAETVESRGASKMFGKTSLKKVTLRAVTEDETEDWMEALTRGYI